MILSICIPTISTRQGLLSRLLWSIGEQAEGFEDQFEVLVYPGDDIAYGDKLNRMFAEAQGEWVVAVGDDDWLPATYLQMVPLLADRNPDFLGYKILYLKDGKYQYEITHTAEVSGWPSNTLRGVCQTCPVRTSIARQVPFGNDYYDDRVWSAEVEGLVQTHMFVNRVMYCYDYGESVGTQPAEGWVDSGRVGVWDYRFPWWKGPTWVAT